jgi:hypothetical protein
MPENAPEIRGLIAIVFLGLLIVGTAMLFLLWPLGATGEARTTTVNFRSRVEEPDQASGVTLTQRFLDLGVCVGVIVGLVAAFMAWIGNKRQVLLGLMVIGILGVAYASGMTLYTGPAVFMCGFLLVLFGGLVAWMSSSPDEATDEPPDKTDETHDQEQPVDLTTNRTNDNASQSVA